MESVQPVPPFVLVDDDGWLDLYDNFEDLVQHLEAPYLDEITWLIDGEARTITLAVHGDDIELADVRPATDLSGLQAAVDRFFEEWTLTAPPEHNAVGSAYVAALVDALRSAEFRKRRRRL